MRAPEPAGCVLLLCDDPSQLARLARWIAATGHEVVTVSGADKFTLTEGDDLRFNLVVTDFNVDDEASRALLERLLSGDLFRATPALHVCRDLTLLGSWRRMNPSIAAVTIPAPPQAEDFQGRLRLAAELGRQKRESARHATSDELTGLPNRRTLLSRLEAEFARARRYRSPLSLALIDVDRLKEVNEHLGQSAGDAVIRKVGELIRQQVRHEDVPGRMGDDMFGIVLPGNRCRGAAVLANKVRTDAAESIVRHAGTEIAVRLSCGISTYPDNREIETPDDLVTQAITALRAAKARGGNRIFIDEEVLRKERPVVLVVDADSRLLDAAEDLLSLDDFDVVKVGTASTAMETMSLRQPDLLVLDLGMIDSAEGVALIDRVRHEFPGTRFPIIGLSADPAMDPERMLRLGVDRLITKPFSVSLLRSAARELLDDHRP